MTEFRQELPPPGGYSPITYTRVPPSQGLGPITKFGIMIGISAVGWYFFLKTRDKLNNEKIEMRCATFALKPMLQAEADRMYLKQLRKNRDAEERLMKDVKGWEVGKYKGSPVYLSLDPDEYFKPDPIEYYAHTDAKHYKFTKKIFEYM